MKRLILIASVAILAAGCQKTFVNEESQTPIGFSTEVGKQTRAIVSSEEYLTSQPFAVYAYGHQDETNKTNTIMNNIEVGYTAATTGDNPTPAKWAATKDNSVTTVYYWPNDPRTIINFYAYSPAHNTTPASATENHQKLSFATGNGNGVSHNETNGLKLTNYVHTNMYVDFMVGRPVLKATYAEQGGTNNSEKNLTSVPMSFNHEMTQVAFNVKTSQEYTDVTFTVESIVLNNIGSQSTYTHTTMTPSYVDTDAAFTKGAWTAPTVPTTYTVFPAITTGVNNAPQIGTDSNTDNKEDAVVVTSTTTLATTPVTMIPQTFTASVEAEPDANPVVEAVNGQSFTITYTIEGTGVAKETVVKTLDFNNGNHTAWNQNTKVTYNIAIGLNEITFDPKVVGWANGLENINFAQ